jgi:glycosyltransferase involved in cell wall biosynthesis
MKEKRICLITFSNNADHQNTTYSMFNALYPKHDVFAIGIINPKTNIAPKTEKNFYIRCPERPGVEKGTFNIKVLFEIKKIIDKNNIDIIYFESQHIWNLFVMLLCPFKTKIVAVHDVIPHDGNKLMALSNFVTCHLAKHVILRNYMFKDILSKKYKIDSKKITCFELWRDYPQKTELTFSNTFLYFGRIRKYKGFDLFAQIIEKTPDIKYRIVGAADKESQYLVDYVRNFNNVSLVDYEVSDTQMIEEFKNADWVVLPYSNATQSGVITDACRYARPVISFNVGAIKEQIQDGKTGFLIQEKDVDAFADKVKEVSKYSKEQLICFSDAAYEFGYKKYSAEYFAEDFYNVLEKV